MNLVHTIYEPSGDGPHPTLIALHGWGANSFDLLSLAPHLGQGRFLVLCPEGAVEVPLAEMGVGFGWFPLTVGAPPDARAFHDSVDQLVAFLDAAERRYPIATNKVALLGFSQGGVVAYALALRQRQRFAALAALSSWLPRELVEAPGTSMLDSLPVLVQHGSQDDLIDAARGRESVELLRRLNASVTYREYEMAHQIIPESLVDLIHFLDEKVLSPIILV